MSNSISHIFDHSSCLSIRQLREYVSGTQTHEERHATEHHLNDCSLCSEAAEGLFARNGEAANLSAAVNSNFLKQHIKATHPQDHAPASHPVRAAQRRPRFSRAEGGSPMAFAPLVSAVFILCGYLLWQRSQPATVKGNAAHAAAPAPAQRPAPASEAVVIPVRHKAGKPKATEPEVVHIPPAAQAEVESMRKARVTSPELSPLQPKPVSLRPAVAVEAPKKNMMVVSGESTAGVNRPPAVDLRKLDQSKPAKKLEVEAFKADGHAAVKPEVQVLNKSSAPVGSKPEAQALNKTSTPIGTKPEAQALNRPSGPIGPKPEAQALAKPEPHAAKPDVQIINKSDAQAFNLPKAQPAPPKPVEAEAQTQEQAKPAADQFESREAAMTAARNLQKLGKEDEARQILNDLAGSSGAQKRAARKMLRKMNNGEE